MAARRIRWHNPAKRQYVAAIEYILEDSVQNAEKVEKRFREKLAQIASLPYVHPPDKYKIDNDGSYRSFTVFRYVVSYRVTKYDIRILRVRHASMKPRSY